jgi:DNA-binding MarR family transcriptional regulator
VTTDDPRLTAMGLLAETYAGLYAKLAPTFAGHGMAPAEFEVLLRLGRSPSGRLRMTDLAAQADLSTSGVTRVVDRLERSGLVRREHCPSDRRGSFAVLTGDGAARLADVVDDHVADIETWFTGALSPVQLTGLLDALRTIRKRVRPAAAAESDGRACGPSVCCGAPPTGPDLADVSGGADAGDDSAG